MIVMLRAENTCPIVFHFFFCGESKRVKGVLKKKFTKVFLTQMALKVCNCKRDNEEYVLVQVFLF